MESNFEKYSANVVDTLNTPYDYASIMHYGPYSFSSNNRPTIEPIQSNIKIGQRNNLSAIDIQQVRRYYNCTINGPTLTTVITTTAKPTTKSTTKLMTTIAKLTTKTTTIAAAKSTTKPTTIATVKSTAKPTAVTTAKTTTKTTATATSKLPY